MSSQLQRTHSGPFRDLTVTTKNHIMKSRGTHFKEQQRFRVVHEMKENSLEDVRCNRSLGSGHSALACMPSQHSGG